MAELTSEVSVILEKRSLPESCDVKTSVGNIVDVPHEDRDGMGDPEHPARAREVDGGAPMLALREFSIEPSASAKRMSCQGVQVEPAHEADGNRIAEGTKTAELGVFTY